MATQLNKKLRREIEDLKKQLEMAERQTVHEHAGWLRASETATVYQREVKSLKQDLADAREQTARAKAGPATEAVVKIVIDALHASGVLPETKK